MTRVLIVRFGRGGGGEGRRVDSWSLLLEQPDIEVDIVDVLAAKRPSPATAPAVLRGAAVPEALSWSPRPIVERADAFGADAILVVTARAFSPAFCSRPVLLDLVDPLEESYRQRAEFAGAGGLPWKVLAQAHERFAGQLAIRPILAGWTDAKDRGAMWIPNVLAGVSAVERPRQAEHDLVFFGSLGYAPNVDAVRRLERMFGRSGHRVLLAGRAPDATVREIVRRCDWRLLEDYASVADLARSATLAVSPLRATAGLQNKVLEAAAVGLPQVVSPQSLRGFEPGFPVTAAASDEDFVRAVEELLGSPDAAEREARQAQDHVATRYVAATWRPTVAEAVGRAIDGASA